MANEFLIAHSRDAAARKRLEGKSGAIDDWLANSLEAQNRNAERDEADHAARMREISEDCEREEREQAQAELGEIDNTFNGIRVRLRQLHSAARDGRLTDEEALEALGLIDHGNALAPDVDEWDQGQVYGFREDVRQLKCTLEERGFTQDSLIGAPTREITECAEPLARTYVPLHQAQLAAQSATSLDDFVESHRQALALLPTITGFARWHACVQESISKGLLDISADGSTFAWKKHLRDQLAPGGCSQAVFMQLTDYALVVDAEEFPTQLDNDVQEAVDGPLRDLTTLAQTLLAAKSVKDARMASAAAPRTLAELRLSEQEAPGPDYAKYLRWVLLSTTLAAGLALAYFSGHKANVAFTIGLALAALWLRRSPKTWPKFGMSGVLLGTACLIAENFIGDVAVAAPLFATCVVLLGGTLLPILALLRWRQSAVNQAQEFKALKERAGHVLTVLHQLK